MKAKGVLFICINTHCRNIQSATDYNPDLYKYSKFVTCHSYISDFHARINGTKEYYGVGETVIFDHMLESSGTDYDVTTGIFTCPVTGLYSFSSHLMSKTTRGDVRFIYLFTVIYIAHFP